jgi:metallo-beta-lactamase class B
MRMIVLVLSLLAFGAQRTASEREAWNKPVEPFRIIGNVYFVGAEGVSAFLIRTSEGLVLLDGALPETAPWIAKNIATLGFNLRDVKVILNSHAHFDHGGGLAELKRLTGASLAVSALDAPAIEAGESSMPAVRVDRRLADGDTVRLGDTTLTAHLTPGHTKGCTTWTMTAKEESRDHTVLFHCSTSVVDRLVGNTSYPNIVADYERTFAKLRAMKADVFLTNHPWFFGMDEKLKARQAGGANPFIDPLALGRFNDRQEQQFRAALEKGR